MSLNIPEYFLVRHMNSTITAFSQTIDKLLEVLAQKQVKTKRKLEENKLKTLNSPAVF